MFEMTNEEISRMFQQVVALYKEKQYDQCLGMLEKMEIALPQNRDVLYHKALCLASLRRLDDAMACCQNLKGQFSDNRVEELQQWIVRNTPSSVSKQYQEIQGESAVMRDTTQPQTQAGSQPLSKAPVSPPPSGGATMFCPKCGTENDRNNYKCSWCGGILHPSPQPMETGPFSPTPQVEKMARNANISFWIAIIGWFCGTLVFGISAVIGAEGNEPGTAIYILALGLMGLSFILFIGSVIFGIMGVKADNTINRWKAIAGLVMGILGVGSMGCCIFLVIVVLLGMIQNGEFPGGFKPQ
jgi:hypothetical protein